MKKISSIALWVCMAITVVVAILFFTGGEEAATLSTGQETTAPAQLDALLYWMYAAIAVGVVLLLVFACKTLATMFQTDAKAAIKSIVTVAAFIVLMAACYFASPEKEFSRVVNGEVEVYSETTMKIIDMWLYSFYVLIGATIALVAGFSIKRLIFK